METRTLNRSRPLASCRCIPFTAALLHWLPGLLVCLVYLVGLPLGAPALAAGAYVEDFTTTLYRDAAQTTADWNTTAGELRLFPFTPAAVGSCATPSFPSAIAVAGDYAFVADGSSGLQVLDVSDPAHPVVVGSHDTSDYARGVAVEGNLALVASNWGELYVFDISDPTNPTLYPWHTSYSATVDVAICGDLAVLAEDPTGLVLVDISDPSNTVLRGYCYTGGEAKGVAYAGDLAFVAAGAGGLYVVDFSDPDAPFVVGSYDTPDDAWDVAVAGNHAYVADATTGLVVIDVSDPAAPTLYGTCDTPGIAYSVTVDGDLALVGDGNVGLQMIDIADPSAPEIIGLHEGLHSIYGIAAAGDVVYVADLFDGVHAVSVRSAVPPVIIGSCSAPQSEAIAVAGDYAYTATRFDGLRVIDIGDPTNPQVIGTCTDCDEASDVCVAGNTAYVADRETGLCVIDVSDPTDPTRIATWITAGRADLVAVAGDFAYVVDDSVGLVVIDVSDRSNPTYAGHCLLPEFGWGIDVEGDYAFVACDTGDLQVVDVSDPSNPFVACDFDSPGLPFDIQVEGDIAVLADGFDGLQLLDVSDPTSPVIVGHASTVDWGIAVAVSGNLAVIGEGFGGIEIFDISDPTLPVLTAATVPPAAVYTVAVAGDLAFLTLGFSVMQFQQHEVDTALNVGQSLAVDGGLGAIARVRLTPEQTGAIAWQLSSDGGVSWSAEIAPASWTRFADQGVDLRWRSTHAWARGTRSAATALTLEWLGESPVLMSVADVPADQGGRVLLHLERSGYDFADETEQQITEYHVWLRIDQAAARERVLSPLGWGTGSGELDGEFVRRGSLWFEQDGRPYVFAPDGMSGRGEMPPGLWASAGGFPAIQQPEYAFIAETLADSSQAGIPWSMFCVTAHTANPGVWFASLPDSGYSVDNLPPAAPEDLAFLAPGILGWDEAAEEDFAYHTVYGSESEVLDETAELIGYTVEAEYDVSGESAHFFHVTTSDAAGNEGEAATIESPASSVPDDAALPARFAVGTVHPTPFRGQTAIAFDLPAPGRVQLRIYDAGGRCVATLSDTEWPAGRHAVGWDGRNDAGARVGPGLYFARVVVGKEEAVRRLVLVE